MAFTEGTLSYTVTEYTDEFTHALDKHLHNLLGEEATYKLFTDPDNDHIIKVSIYHDYDIMMPATETAQRLFSMIKETSAIPYLSVNSDTEIYIATESLNMLYVDKGDAYLITATDSGGVQLEEISSVEAVFDVSDVDIPSYPTPAYLPLLDPSPEARAEHDRRSKDEKTRRIEKKKLLIEDEIRALQEKVKYMEDVIAKRMSSD